ncbi:MAG: 50S ribosomal protein L21 [Clostridia bacterium]|nr:50S ribosomal protein L21 [Clostridia bacterium]
MYAIIENGSKQYTAKVGDIIKFEKLNAEVGANVEFNVLLVSSEEGVKLGEDAKGYKVVGEVLAHDKAKKVIVYKYKAKKNERKKRGHRQPFTAVKINEIVAL